MVANKVDQFDYLPVAQGRDAIVVGMFHARAHSGCTSAEPVAAHMEVLAERHLVGADASILEFIVEADARASRLVVVGRREFLEAGKRRLAGDTARAATTSEVTDLRREARALKGVVAEQALELRLLKKSMIAMGRRGMRYPGSEKLEIIPYGQKTETASKALI
jgi:hypothetical protein